MTLEEKAQLLQRIDKKISIAKRKIGQMEEMTQPIAPENSIGRISRMDAINNKSVMEAALRNAKIELEGLSRAKRTINQVNFGICEECGKEIPVNRLMALPGSAQCMLCAR